MTCPHLDVEYCRCDQRVVSDDEWESMEAERDRYKAALLRISRLEDFKDAHHAPDIARRALRGEQGEP